MKISKNEIIKGLERYPFIRKDFQNYEDLNDLYYHILTDLLLFPDAWAYFVYSKRGPGKTYSVLWLCYYSDIKFIYMKRTDKDVNLILSNRNDDFDPSPYKDLKRDKGLKVVGEKIDDGIGGFYECDKDNNPIGKPLGYIVSLNSVSKVKGFDMSECEWIIFDEFIPQPWERVDRKEGEKLMDLYKTVSRDREHRGLPPLKLICLANATKISNPVCNILEITDKLVDMQVGKTSIFIDESRGIFVHQINDNTAFVEKEKQSLIYKAMASTEWGKMALSNEFAYDDFTAVKKSNLKGFMPLFAVKFKSKTYYIYNKEGIFYMTLAPAKVYRTYNLKIENDQKAFYIDKVIDLQEASIEGRVMFEQYTMYDLIMNYKSFFKI